jgi:hypothetical protein
MPRHKTCLAEGELSSRLDEQAISTRSGVSRISYGFFGEHFWVNKSLSMMFRLLTRNFKNPVKNLHSSWIHGNFSFLSSIPSSGLNSGFLKGAHPF